MYITQSDIQTLLGQTDMHTSAHTQPLQFKHTYLVDIVLNNSDSVIDAIKYKQKSQQYYLCTVGCKKAE